MLSRVGKRAFLIDHFTDWAGSLFFAFRRAQKTTSRTQNPHLLKSIVDDGDGVAGGHKKTKKKEEEAVPRNVFGVKTRKQCSIGGMCLLYAKKGG